MKRLVARILVAVVLVAGAFAPAMAGAVGSPPSGRPFLSRTHPAPLDANHPDHEVCPLPFNISMNAFSSSADKVNALAGCRP
jgi:hypothetical protein